ncbi:MAG TPA: hypothetical protein EYP14_01580, partial [Planctomycetaceae bacterium]|nr:hypothetical protein [Planctomycetaceae bacterium]
MDFPEDMPQQRFQYVGAAEGPGPSLRVAFQNAATGSTCRLVLLTFVALLFWWIRAASLKARAVLALWAVTAPVALMPLAPPLAHVFLEGLLLGSLVGLLLWAIHRFVTVLHWWWERLLGRVTDQTEATEATGAAMKVGTGLLLLGLLVPTDLTADEVRLDQGASTEGTAAKPVRAVGPAVLVPYDPDQDPLSAQHVLLPYEQFLRLWNLAHPDQPLQKPAPVPAVASAAYYSIELADVSIAGRRRTVANVQGRLVLHSFQPQAEVRLPLDAVPVVEARLDDRPTAVRSESADGRASLSVLIPKVGRHVLDLRFQLPVRQEGPAGELTVPLRPVPAGKLALTLPASGLDVRINGSERRGHRTKSTETERIEVPIDAGGPLTIAWRPPRTVALGQRFVQVESSLALLVDDAGLFLVTGHRIRVRRGRLHGMDFALPETLRVETVQGPDVAGWMVDGADEGRRLRITFRRPIEDQTLLECRLFCRAAAFVTPETWHWPALRALDVSRETGTVGVFAAPPFQVRASMGPGLRRIDASEFRP